MTEKDSAFIRTVRYGRRKIPFELRFSSRKTLGIEVYPDLSVVAIAPNGADTSTVDEKVQKRAPWILKQQTDFESFLPILPGHKYISGESFRYLGRQHKLRIFKAKAEKVRMHRGQLQVSLPDRTDSAKIEKLLTEWFRNKADQIIGELWPNCVNRVRQHGIEPRSYRLRQMKTRWGSCSKNGNILLNPELVTAPRKCIEYVIIHELCHLKHYNHGAEFFELLSVLVPDWEARRKKLNLNVRG